MQLDLINQHIVCHEAVFNLKKAAVASVGEFFHEANGIAVITKTNDGKNDAFIAFVAD